LKPEHYVPPNSPLSDKDFSSRGGHEVFKAILDIINRLSAVEEVSKTNRWLVVATGGLLGGLLVAILAKVY
jgi:hypothetical protein